MFRLSENPKVRGNAFRILNGIRVCNIITLLANMAATWALAVMTIKTNSFFFFDFINHISIFGINVYLFGSEIQFKGLKKYYSQNWPVFGKDHSFFWLGSALVMLGFEMLGSLNKPQFSTDNLGMTIWRLVVAAGSLSLGFGLINWISSIIFRDGKNGITARRFRSDGNLASAKVDAADDYYSAHAGSVRQASVREKEAPRDHSKVKRFTQAFTKSPFAGKKKPEISHPIPYPRDDDVEAGGNDSWADDRASPVNPVMQRPPTAMHPAYTGGNHSSHYSVAHMDRF